jgi:hypothetical protein
MRAGTAWSEPVRLQRQSRDGDPQAGHTRPASVEYTSREAGRSGMSDHRMRSGSVPLLAEACLVAHRQVDWIMTVLSRRL